MGQLIKLENYISRYQRDIYHYPGQFIRLKKDNWKKLNHMWQMDLEQANEVLQLEEAKEKFRFFKWKDFFPKRTYVEDDIEERIVLPKTTEGLKQYFLDSLFPFQLNWASKTINEMSFLDPSYHDDLVLKYFLQRFPDTFLFMYQPVFQLKKATLDADIIIITPISVEIIKLVEKPSEERIIVNEGRTWYVEKNKVRTKMLSPMLSLIRTEKIVKGILSFRGVEMPINKVILSRTNVIDFDHEPFQTTFVDKNKHNEWLEQQKNLVSPLKYNQLKVADALLSHSDTVSVYRPEWDQKETDEL